MKPEQLKNVLDDISRKNIPDNLDLLPGIEKKLRGTGGLRVLPARRFGTALAIALVVLLALAGAAYAAYRLFWDKGLQGVKDAGLGAEPNSTAQSTLLPDVTSDSAVEVPPMMLGITQTWEDGSVTLDWVSLNSFRLLIGFTASGLPADVSLGMPVLTFSGAEPLQPGAAYLFLKGTQPVSGEYLAYQVINDVPQGSTVGIGIDLPLVKSQGGTETVAATLHFDLQDVPADSNRPGVYQQTYASKVNGLGMSLVWARVTETSTTARLCYSLPKAGQDWQPMLASIQFSDATGSPLGEPALANSSSLVSTINEERCVELGFPLGTGTGGRMARLSVAHLAAGSDVRDGPWTFDISLPDELPAAEPTATPTLSALDTETISGVTAVLQWAYADSSRTAMLIHFDGWQSGDGVGQITVSDDTGAEINTGYGIGSPGDDPSTFLLTLYFDPAYMAGRTELKLHLDMPVTTPQDQSKPLASFRFDLDLPVYQARTVEPGMSLAAGGLELKVVKASITPSYTDLTLCYQKPTHADNSDWMPGRDTTVTVLGSSAQMDGYRLLSDADYGGYTGKGTPPADLPLMDNGRCVQAGFAVGSLAEHGTVKITLNVPGLELSMPEVIPDEQLLPALEALKGQGIDISVYSSSGSGGGGGGWTVNAKPEGMTDEQAYQKFLEALGYTFTGPWVFEITIP